MIVDSGAPVSMCGLKWIKQSLANFGLEMEEVASRECNQVFKFGPSKRYRSNIMMEIPLIVHKLDGKDDLLKVMTYVLDVKVLV